MSGEMIAERLERLKMWKVRESQAATPSHSIFGGERTEGEMRSQGPTRTLRIGLRQRP